MKRLSAWKTSAVVALCIATAIAAHGQTFTSLVNLDGSNGKNIIYMSLVQGVDGNLYGTTWEGGADNRGTIFKMTLEGTLTTLHSFTSHEGDGPNSGLLLATDGNFYGTTISGGTSRYYGTVYRVTPQGKLTTLHNFCTQLNCSDGAYPVGPLVQSAEGDLYGTTSEGGSNICDKSTVGCGTVFEITPTGSFLTVSNFDSNKGYYPYAGLIQATNGKLYGTTTQGGPGACTSNVGTGCGTVFSLTPGGVLTTIYNFDITHGANPIAGIIQGANQSLYGTTSAGGANEYGTVFAIAPNGVLSSLHDFDGTDGASPFAGVIQGTDGNLYGATSSTLNNYLGTLFSITPTGSLTTVVEFDGVDGSEPYGGLVQATNGDFCGTTRYGGTYGDGTIYELDMGLGPFVTFVRSYGKVGQTGGILGQGFTGTTSVMLNGAPASFTVESDTYIQATVPAGATTGFVTVTTPSGTLTSNVPFHVIP